MRVGRSRKSISEVLVELPYQERGSEVVFEGQLNMSMRKLAQSSRKNRTKLLLHALIHPRHLQPSTRLLSVLQIKDF
jgi:hypothetical protein